MTQEELAVAAHDNACGVQENARRITRLEKRQDNLDRLVTSVAALAAKQERMDRDVGEIKEAVSRMELAPARRWERVAEKALLALVAALVGCALTYLGIG